MKDILGKQVNQGDEVVTIVMKGHDWKKIATLRVTTVEQVNALSVKLKGLRKSRCYFEIYKI